MDTRGALELFLIAVLLVGPFAYNAVDSGDEELTEAGIEAEIREDVNEERVAHGLEPLDQSDELAAIADNHSKDMIERDYYAHDSPDGQTFQDRYEANDVYCAGGENLNKLTVPSISDDKSDIANRTVDSWMGSEGHRYNILREDYDRQGIGVEIVEEGNSVTFYVTQNFC